MSESKSSGDTGGSRSELPAADADSPDQKVDWNVAREVTAGDLDLLLEVLDAFQIETPQMVVKIREALQTSDTELLHRAAHTAKNAFYNIGAQETGDLAFQLEMAGKNQTWETVPALLEQLERDMQLVEREVAAFLRAQAK